MNRIIHSLLFRIAVLFVAGFFVLQAAILLTVAWPDDRPVMFRLVDPADAREIAEAIERAPGELRPAIAAAASNAAMRVELRPALPGDAGADEALRPAPQLEARFRAFAEELDSRPIAVQVRDGGLLSYGLRGDGPPRGPIRLLVKLRSGEVLVIERVPVVLRQLASRYFAIALVAAVILALLMATLLWQVVRPVARLAETTEAFRSERDAPDAPLTGAREIRGLAAAFNAMKQRIGGLVGERTRILAAIAHDQRTYLTRLRLRVEQIADERQRRQAIADVEEMGLLLDDILLFARKDVDDRHTAPVIDVREEVLSYIETRREAGDIIDVTAPVRPLFSRCAPLVLRRILGNLIDNAIRYGTRAHVTLSGERDYIEIAVTDDGPGVPPEFIGRLTAPFERVEESRGRHSGGAGLGLAIVKGLVESHGGSLAFENGTGRGLCAIVKLPSANAGDSPPD